MAGNYCIGLFFLLLVACVSQQPVSEPVVEKVLLNCWDNSTVDSLDDCPPQKVEEVKVEKAPAPKIVEKTLMQQLLEKAPTSYYYYDGLDGIIVSGTKRSNGEYNEFWNAYARIMFWDTATKAIYILAPRPIKEYWWLEKQGINKTGSARSAEVLPAFFELKLTGNEEADETLIPKEFNKYWFDAEEDELLRIVRPFYSKGPMDWMREYAEDVPVKVDSTSVMLSNVGGNVQSNLSITYENKNKLTPFIVFRFDTRLNVPLFIDDLDDKGKIVKRYSFEFGVDYVSQQKRIKITENLVSLPENSIIISVKDFEEYAED